MNTAPTGLVTFLFTDIEGSTKLAQAFPDSYQMILQNHNLILKETIELHNGFVFKMVGDAYCAAFGKAGDAVSAAIEIQEKLILAADNKIEVKVRMGIHSGEAEYVNGDYSGYITLSRVQRIMSVAYGGQILISQEVYEAVKDINGDKFSFKDLGKRKLKDIVLHGNIYQIVAKCIPADFPPLQSLDARGNNLPLELNSFIGRENETIEIRKLMQDIRLLTVAGFGGTGKTRLVVHVAYKVIDEFANGVCFVELAKLTESSNVLQEITSVLRVVTDEKRKMMDVLIDFLREKELLLILDNCEHLISECAKITEVLLQKCPKLKIIITSRESLHIFGETVYHLPPLSLPDLKEAQSLKTLSENESVRLFVDRVLSGKQDFELTMENASAVAQLCYQMDGIPLAIELAAARVKVMSVEKILARLEDVFSLLTGGKRTLLPRQQTLRALIDWSYDLLSEKEKILCRRLSVFSGGWILEAAENVCSDEILDEYEILDLLSNLSDKSLIKVTERDNNFRYSMLQTIRKYGDEKLIEANEKSVLLERHFDFFYKFAENSESGLTGTDQREILTRIGSENENIRSSLRWALANNPLLSLQMSVVLGKFWELRSHFTEGLEFLGKSLKSSENVHPVWKAKAIYWTGFFLIHQGKYSESKKYLNECLEMFRELKDKDGEAVTLISLATIALFEIDYVALKSYSDKSLLLSLEVNNRSYIARNLQNIALSLMQQGQHEEARKNFEESISIYKELNDQVQLAKIISNVGALEYLETNYEKATAAFEESLRLRQELGDRQGVSIALNNLGSVAYMQKDFDESERLLEESLEIIRELGDRRVYVTPISTLGSIASDKGDFPKAIKLFREAIIISNEIGDNYSVAKGIEGIACISVAIGKFKEGCSMAAKYILLLESSNKNVIEGELVRIEEIKTTLKLNLSEAEFEKYWTAGEGMSIEKILELALVIDEQPVIVRES